VPSFVFSLLVLGLLVALGVVAIVMIRSRWLKTGDDHGDWEKTLVDCKNLRDTGLLTEDEYRKIRTLVEPRVRFGSPDSSASRPSVVRWPAADGIGPDKKRN
jgi:hypothetical protein